MQNKNYDDDYEYEMINSKVDNLSKEAEKLSKNFFVKYDSMVTRIKEAEDVLFRMNMRRIK